MGQQRAPSVTATVRRAGAEDHRDAALAAQARLPPNPVGDHYQGGPFCSDEFDNGIERGADVSAVGRVGVFAVTRRLTSIGAIRFAIAPYDERPSKVVTLSVAMSTSSRQRTLSAIISPPPFGDFPREKAATPHCGQNR